MIRTLPSYSTELERAALESAARRYLVATRSAAPDEYERIEADAWHDLLRALERLGGPLPPETQE